METKPNTFVRPEKSYRFNPDHLSKLSQSRINQVLAQLLKAKPQSCSVSSEGDVIYLLAEITADNLVKKLYLVIVVLYQNSVNLPVNSIYLQETVTGTDVIKDYKLFLPNHGTSRYVLLHTDGKKLLQDRNTASQQCNQKLRKYGIRGVTLF